MGEPLSRYPESIKIEPVGAARVQNVSQDHTGKALACQLQESEELLRLDNPQASQDKKYLPGVGSERRFHRYHPDILIHNVLLRKLLREQALSGGMYSGRSTNANSKIVHGFACGDQNRLHAAVTIISEAVPGRLYCALLTHRPVRLSKGDVDYSGQDYTLESGSHNHFDFPRSIVDVVACTGQSNPVFLVRTENDVYAISLAFKGEKRLATVNVQIVCHITSDLLHDCQPIATICTYTDHWILCILTTDGVLCIWDTVSWPRTQPALAEFRQISKIKLPFDGDPCQDILFKDPVDPDVILLVYQDKILSASTLSRTIRLFYREDTNAKIIEVKIFYLPSRKCVGYVFTNSNLVVLEFQRTPVTLGKWAHHFTVLKAPRLHVCTSAGSVSILLHSAIVGLCCLYTVDINDNRSYQFPAKRLNLDTKESPACLDPYLVSCTSKTSTIAVLGVLYISYHNSVMHTLYGPENTRITFLRAQKLLGPAMVRSISGSKMELDHVDEAMSILDMRSWYTSLQRNASSSDRPEPSRPVQSATSQASTLSYEVLEFERMSLLDFDAYFETLIDNQRDQGVTVDEIRGLRIYEDSAESVDPDSHTAYSIFRMMRAWRGSSTLLNGVTNVHEQTTKQSHEIAAISLAQAAVVLSARSEKESALIAVKRYDDPSSTDEPSRAMENLLDDWHVGQDPTSYIWNSLESRRDMSKEKPFAVQEIPAFRQLPPVVASSQAPSSPARRQQVPPSSQDVMQFASTQPVQGKFGDRKVKRKKKAGF